MADQGELNLPAVPLPPKAGAGAGRSGFAGLSWMQALTLVLTLCGLIWGMWVTRLLVSPRQDQIVTARLSAIVGDYVQAQARSALPPAQVEAEMRRFMASLDRELQSRSASGQVVLVGEAVLTKNVPDITESLKTAVYASGVTHPRPATAEELQRLDRQAIGASPPGAAVQGEGNPPATLDPMATAQTPGPVGAPPPSTPAFGGGDVPGAN